MLRNRNPRPRRPEGIAALRASRRQVFGLVGAGALGASAVLAGRQLARSEPDPAVGDDADAPLTRNRQGALQVAWSVESDKSRVALTFDDGPDPRFTPQVLDILGRYDVKATFLAMGYNAAKHSGLMNEVVDAGHEIGSHTWSHRHFPDLTPEQTAAEITRGATAIEDVTGKAMELFRPPKGRMTEAAFTHVAQLGYDVVMWSATRGALAERDPSVVAANVVDGISAGDIVLLHDGIGRGTFDPGGPVEAELTGRRTAEVDGLSQIIEDILDRDLKLATIGEMLARQYGE